jgi:hypothetical protein
MKNCDKCGAVNEGDVNFCVSCGNKLVGNVSHIGASHGSRPHMDMPQQQSERPAPERYMSDEEMMRLRSVPNPVVVMWEKLLFPERMIAVAAILNIVLAIFWASSNYLSVPMAILYFASMGASLALTYLSSESSLTKKIEWSRWQIVIGAFWLSWLFNIAFRSYGYYDVPSGLLVFNTIFSVGMLSGAMMLQGILVQYVFQQKK